MEQTNAERTDTISDENDALERQQANEHDAQESEPAGKTGQDCMSVEEQRSLEWWQRMKYT